MILPFFRPGFVFSFWVFVASFASGQEATVSLRFLAFPAHAEPEPVELVTGKGETIKVDTPGNELSRSYQVPNLDTITVGKTSVDKEGKPVFITYGQAVSIPAKQQIVLLLRKGDANSDGFVVMPLSAELTAFSGASFLFINASKIKVGGRIGNKNLELNPGQRTLLKPAPDFPGGICQVTLGYFREDKWKVFFDTRWPANEKSRAIIFFYQNPQTGRLGIAPITDVLPNRQEGVEPQ